MPTLVAPFSTNRGLDLAGRSLTLPHQRTAPAAPMDAVRTDDAITLYVDLPGVDPESIDLTVDRRVLSLSAERRWSPGDGEAVVVRERSQGSIRRQIRLSDQLDPNGVEARYDHGVLVVRVPVAESAQPRRVEIATTRTAGEVDPGDAQSAELAAAGQDASAD